LPARRGAFPRAAELFKALVLLAVAASLGGATARARFQLIDWDVESRDLQARLRRAEREAASLRRDVARLKSPDRLAQIAAEQLGVAKLPPESVTRLRLEPQRVEAWDKALRAAATEREPRNGENALRSHANLASLEPVAAMIAPPRPTLQPQTARVENALHPSPVQAVSTTETAEE
jgi:hypothetical protein